jgi:hypothetical protein
MPPQKKGKSKSSEIEPNIDHDNQNTILANSIPKKRGRKPKGGKIVKIDNGQHTSVVSLEKKAVIMHLKCSMEDLSTLKSDSIIDNVEFYNPNIPTIEPFTDDKTLYSLYNNETLNTGEQANDTNDAYTSQINSLHVTSMEKNESPYEIISTNDSHSLNVNKDTIAMKTHTCHEKHNETTRKVINSKLKELEQNLNLNTVKSNSACFWCTYEFNTPNIYIPTLYHSNKYDVYGCFCSPECACSYLFSENIDTNTKFERYQLLNYIYGSIYKYTKNIKPAPNPFYTLDRFCGNLTIQEYRQLLEYDRMLLVIDKPLTRIYPELHEDNSEFETIYENKISLKRSTKVNKNNVLNRIFNT